MSIEYIKKNSRHHAFTKSEYFEKDRDEEWNMFELDYDDHYCIHHGSTDEEIQRGKIIANELRLKAITRYKGENREKLEKILKSRKRG